MVRERRLHAVGEKLTFIPDGPEDNATEIRFPEVYVASPLQRARDLLLLDLSQRRGSAAVDLRRRPAEESDAFDLRIYSSDATVELDALIPLLHNLGLRAVDQNLSRLSVGSAPRLIRNVTVRPLEGANVAQSRRQLLKALTALLSGEATDDPLNQLILLSGLGWRDVDVLRAYSHFFVQLGGRIGRTRLYEALIGNPTVTKLLFAYFETRFRPDHAGAGALDAFADIRQRLVEALDAVVDVTDDNLLRDLFNLIDATLRTNFYLPSSVAAIGFKFDSLGVMSAPSPRPYVEIFVYAPTFEGVHLRGAKVARGGLRWSDRAHDLRSEILDLMQTQMVKNALIVPQGAKGGFVLRTPSSNSKAREAQGKEAYRRFIGALLDLTDNIESPRLSMRVYDDPDPYLVVAADKGTAGWSDIANQIAVARGFWLGDAFATGGSNGYHHKKLGITARGAWVCVRRHFLELGRNIDEETITVVGVGSMDGDVFGNGMLLSDRLKLLGAFSGSHIFIDPDPDPAVSYQERQRLFSLQGSSWADYDPAKISHGGGVWRRDARDIDLSPQARELLGARHRLIDGEGLIRLLLTAPVDLLWMGGVGTYVKAEQESDESVGDRANDGARITAGQLRATVVGEGANLAFTKLARVEYALGGGHINTDAIDNSAGVDLSDHEVNLKILLGHAGSDLLHGMTEQVCAAVLQHNFRQSLALSLEYQRATVNVAPFLDIADRFEAAGRLDRRTDDFPTRKDVLARTEKNLTRPELALLLAYGKLTLKSALIEAPQISDGEWAHNYLFDYFPRSLHDTYREQILEHPLAREIAATVISNRIIDQAGVRFLLFSDPVAPALLLEAVDFYLSFDAILDGVLWRNALQDRTISINRTYLGLESLEETLAYLCQVALLRRIRFAPDKTQIDAWKEDLRRYLAYLLPAASPSTLDALSLESSRELLLLRLRDFPFLADLSHSWGKEIAFVASLFDEAVNVFGLQAISAQSLLLTPRDIWEVRLQESLDIRFRTTAARVVAQMLRVGAVAPAEIFSRNGLMHRLLMVQKLREDLLADAPKTIAPFALFAGELDALIDACEAPSLAS